MDTDDLSKATYNGIILECEKYNHYLTLQFWILASACKDDDDYLNHAESLIKEWLSNKDFDVLADDIFFGETIDLETFKTTLRKLIANINEIRITPINEREYEQW